MIDLANMDLPELRDLRESLLRRIKRGRPGVLFLRARLRAVTTRILELEVGA